MVKPHKPNHVLKLAAAVIGKSSAMLGKKRRRAWGNLAAFAVAATLFATPALAKRNVAPSPPSPAQTAIVVASPAQAQNIIETAAPIIFFGDMHIDQAGRQAVVNLMPTLAQAHVTAIAAELPPSLNPFFVHLQNEIKEKNLGLHQVSEQLAEALGKTVLSQHGTLWGGQASLDSFSKIIIAATRYNITFTGVDGRQDSENFYKNFLDAALSGDSARETNVMFSMEKSNAQRVEFLMNEQPKGSKVAVIMGSEHGCNDGSQPRLMNYLEQRWAVTHINLDTFPVPENSNMNPVYELGYTGFQLDAYTIQKVVVRPDHTLRALSEHRLQT